MVRLSEFHPAQSAGVRRKTEAAIMDMTLYELRPKSAPDSAPISGSESAPAAAPAGSVLLVDDDPDFREMVRIAFLRAGYGVLEAENGLAALAVMADHAVDLVVTDIIMPEAEGIETIIAMRQLRPDVRIVAMSGGGPMNRESLLDMTVKLGATDSLAKPFDDDELARVVERSLA